MKPWHVGFKLDEESPSFAPVWVRLPNLPKELWNEDIFIVIGNALGGLMGISDKTWERDSLSYARICAHLRIDSPLHTHIKINTKGLVYTQELDYENLPFKCRICVEYGHLTKSCPHTQSKAAEANPPPHAFQ